MWRLVAALVVVPLAAAAQDRNCRQLGESGLLCTSHEVAPDTTTPGPISFALFESKIEAYARGYISKYHRAVATRFVHYEYSVPLDAAEYEAMGKHGVMVVAAFSQSASELPLHALKADNLELRCVGQMHRIVPKGTTAARRFGLNRIDAIYLVPIAAIKQGAILTADFTGRSGFMLGKLDADGSPDFILKDQDAARTYDPSTAALKDMVERQYPGFGIEVAP